MNCLWIHINTSWAHLQFWYYVLIVSSFTDIFPYYNSWFNIWQIEHKLQLSVILRQEKDIISHRWTTDIDCPNKLSERSGFQFCKEVVVICLEEMSGQDSTLPHTLTVIYWRTDLTFPFTFAVKSLYIDLISCHRWLLIPCSKRSTIKTGWLTTSNAFCMSSVDVYKIWNQGLLQTTLVMP